MDTLLKAHTAITKTWWLLVLLLAGNFAGKAQEVPLLEKPVTVNAYNQPIAEVFKTLNAQTGVVFSYNPQQFNDKQKVTLTISNKPLRVAMDELLKTTLCSYTLKKKYIIIKCLQPKPKKSTYTITGYLVSTHDSGIITNASIFVKTTRESAISDSVGYFSLTASKSSDPLYLSIAKEEFIDTTMAIHGAMDKELLVYLTPVPKPLPPPVQPNLTVVDTLVTDTAVQVVAVDTLQQQAQPTNRFWERQKKVNANIRNIRDTLFSKVSFSLVPGISTNKLLSFNTINRFSFNLLIGKSKGINGMEIGGLVNYDFGNVQYYQGAGLANIVAGNVKYVQTAGIVNSVLGNMDGVQAAGIYNYLKQHANGVQLGGIFNYARSVYGVQAGGIMNVIGDTLNGVQLGGIFNHVKNSVNGIQVSGIFNTTRKITGAQIGGVFNLAYDTILGTQISGVFNTADYAAGIQVAGVANIADRIDGTQVSGVVNVARVINGAQISVLNVADTCNGLPIGLFSYIKSGYHKIELSIDELQMVSMGFRSGVNRFHNMFFAGITTTPTEKIWAYGYGIGSHLYLTPKKSLQFDITSRQLQTTRISSTIKINQINRLSVCYSYAFTKKLGVVIGPSINLLIHDKTDVDFNNAFTPISPNTFFNNTAGNTQLSAWVGGKFSLMFL